MKNSNRSSLPYLQGGPPGALKVYIGVEAVTSVIMCCASVVGSVYMLIHGIWTVIFTIPLTIYSTVLALRAYSGAKKLRNGDAEGATLLESACSGRRTLIWIAYGFSVLSALITALSSSGSGAGFLGSLIGAGISLLIIFPFINYYKDIEQILGYYVHPEASTGSPVSGSGRTGHLTALCVTFAVLVLAASIAAYFARNISYYSSLITLLLYLVAARYLLVNICYRGFVRSHSSAARDENAAFAPSGYSDSSTLSVLGSIFFGAEALLNLASVIRLLSYGRSLPLQTSLQGLVAPACCILFALALTRRTGRTALILIGAAAMAVQFLILIFTSKSLNLMSLLTVGPIIVFWIMIIIAAILHQKGTTVPKVFRIIMIALAALYTVFYLVSYFSGNFRYFDIGLIAVYLNRLLADGIYFVALLALVQAFTEPAVSETVEPEKEALPDPRGSVTE